MSQQQSIPALMPRTETGGQFVAYGDCCIGPPEPGRNHEQHLPAVHTVLHRLQPRPDFVCFLGDMIWGLTREHGPNFDAEALEAEWQRVLAGPMRPLTDLGAPVYRIAGNHDTFNAVSEQVWRRVFAELPQNGPAGQEGLSYCVRQGDLLVVAIDVYAEALGAPSTQTRRSNSCWAIPRCSPSTATEGGSGQCLPSSASPSGTCWRGTRSTHICAAT